MASTEAISSIPHSQAERAAIAVQIERLVSHSSFKGSRRCQALLRYIVENQLQGETCRLKERMIGIAVFGRNPDYDSNSDPVVRTTATDLRKRLAQYYHEPGHENELRVTLPAGSYRPEFHSAAHVDSKAVSITSDAPAHVDSSVHAIHVVPHRREFSWKPYLLSAFLFVALSVSLALRRPTRPPRTLNDFWSPIARSGSALLCVGTWNVSSITSDVPPSSSTSLSVRDLLPMTDAVAFSRVAAFFGQANLPFRVESAKTTTLTDLTQGPVVLIGAIDNQWTMRVTDHLRFHFIPPDGQGNRWRIADRKEPGHEFTTGPGDVPGSMKDYAIVGRLSDGTSGQMSVVVAGMGAAGTTAASELVTSADYMNYLAGQVPNGFKTKNLEAVISVQVVDSKPGAPHIDSVEAW